MKKSIKLFRKSEAQDQSGRLFGIDFARSICALIIIAFHFSGYSASEIKILHVTATSGWGNIAVTAFFVISGMVLYRGYPTIPSLKVFWFKRWKSIFPMFYICFLYYYLENVFQTRTFFYGPSPVTLLFSLFGMDGYLLYRFPNYYIIGEWFLGAIVILYLLYPIILWITRKHGFIMPVILATGYYIMLGTDIFIIDTFRNIITCMTSFYLGIAAMKHYKLFFQNIMFFIICSFVFLIMTFVTLPINLGRGGVIIEQIQGFSFIIMIIQIGEWIKLPTVRRLFSWISNISFPIFLFQHKIILKVLGVNNPTDALETIGMLLVTILLTIICAKTLFVINKSIVNSKGFIAIENRLCSKTNKILEKNKSRKETIYMQHTYPKPMDIRNSKLAIKKYIWLILMIAAVLVRVSFVDRISPYIIGNNRHDDAWVVLSAKNILDGQWLGAYNQYTLIKGVFAPLLLALSKLLGMTYMHMNTVLYIISCIVFIKAISPFIQNNLSRFLCFIILLFNPVSYALMTWQRVYRNGLSQWQLLFIISSVISIYQNRNLGWKKILPWSLLAGFSLWAFVNSREDSVWIYPFVIVAIIITIINICKENKKWDWKYNLLIVLPMIIVVSGNLFVSLQNYISYGVFLRNDRTEGNYANVVKDLYMIEPENSDKEKYSTEEYKDQYLNIYTSTIKKAYEISPTLATASEKINKAIIGWDSGEAMVDGEAYLDHVLFALRDGVAASGYYSSLTEAESFYQKVHEELQAGFRDGRLMKRKALSLSAGAAPIKWTDIFPTLREMIKTIQFSIKFETVSTIPVKAEGNIEQIALFEEISGDKVIYPDRPKSISGDGIHISGWAFAIEDGTKLSIAICSKNGDIKANASNTESPDVYEYFSQTGKQYENAKDARFSIGLSDNDLVDGMYLCFFDQEGNTYLELPFDSIASQQGAFPQTMYYHIDDYSGLESYSNYEIHMAENESNRLNMITGFYQSAGMPIALLSIISYIICCVSRIRNRKVRNRRIEACWLLETGILLSYFLIAGMMSLMTVTTFNARAYLYLSPMYVLQLAFYGVSIPFAIELIAGILKEKKVSVKE